MQINTKQIDPVAVFLGYCGVCGDVQKVALLFDLDPKLVERLAEENDWNDKIKRLSLVSKDGTDGGEWAKIQNRALSLIQGTMLRKVLQSVLENINQMTREDLTATVTAVKAGSVTFTARFYADLAAAMQSAHQMCYSALGDSASEREKITGGEEPLSIEKLHCAVLQALSSPAGAGAERKLLENETIDITKKV